MPNISYVCLSDLHLGEEDSLLTNVEAPEAINTESPCPVLVRLVECVEELVKANAAGASRPTLILNGDLLELALSTMDQAILVFAQFLKLVMAERKLFKEIIFIPGNHDHHLWETARETQYENYMARLRTGERLEPPWHTTKAVMEMDGKDRLVSRMLSSAGARLAGLEDGFEILVAYPNYALLAEVNGKRRGIVFHHGHLLEDLYAALSVATTYVDPNHEVPKDVYRLEEENFAWIDFFWSTMGRSGRAGENIEKVYESTKNPKRLRALTDRLATTLAERHDIPFIPGDLAEEWTLKKLFRLFAEKVASKQERQRTGYRDPDWLLSEEATRKLKEYLTVSLPKQFDQERTPWPETLTFVFGHTHKPFCGVLASDDGASFPVVNSGGWVVESDEPVKTHGGAVVLADEELNVVNLRVYNEGEFQIRLEEPVGAGAPPSDFYRHVSGIVRAREQPWSTLTSEIEREFRRRAEFRGRPSP